MGNADIKNIKEYLEETMFFSLEIRNFLEAAEKQAWSGQAFLDKLTALLAAADNLMAVSIIASHLLTDPEPNNISWDGFYQAAESKILPEMLQRLENGANGGKNRFSLDEIVNLALTAAKAYPLLSPENKDKIKALAMRLELLGINEVVRKKMAGYLQEKTP